MTLLLPTSRFCLPELLFSWLRWEGKGIRTLMNGLAGGRNWQCQSGDGNYCSRTKWASVHCAYPALHRCAWWLHNELLVYLIGSQSWRLKNPTFFFGNDYYHALSLKVIAVEVKGPIFSNLASLSACRSTGTVIDDSELNWTGAAQCNRARLQSQNAGVSHFFLRWLTNFVFFLPQPNTKV